MKLFYYIFFIHFLAYLNFPCHVEFWATVKEEDVKKEKNKESKAVVKLSRKQIAKKHLQAGH